MKKCRKHLKTDPHSQSEVSKTSHHWTASEYVCIFEPNPLLFFPQFWISLLIDMAPHARHSPFMQDHYLRTNYILYQAGYSLAFERLDWWCVIEASFEPCSKAASAVDVPYFPRSHFTLAFQSAPPQGIQFPLIFLLLRNEDGDPNVPLHHIILINLDQSVSCCLLSRNYATHKPFLLSLVFVDFPLPC